MPRQIEMEIQDVSASLTCTPSVAEWLQQPHVTPVAVSQRLPHQRKLPNFPRGVRHEKGNRLRRELDRLYPQLTAIRRLILLEECLTQSRSVVLLRHKLEALPIDGSLRFGLWRLHYVNIAQCAPHYRLFYRGKLVAAAILDVDQDYNVPRYVIRREQEKLAKALLLMGWRASAVIKRDSDPLGQWNEATGELEGVRSLGSIFRLNKAPQERRGTSDRE